MTKTVNSVQLKNGNLIRALNFLQETIQRRLAQYFKKINGETTLIPPAYFLDENEDSAFTKFVQHYQMNEDELIVLMTALVPNVYPHFFDNIIAEFLPNGGDFPEFGGVKGKRHRGLIPTAETALFILAGTDLNLRFERQKIFLPGHYFERDSILIVDHTDGEPKMSGSLVLDSEYIELFTVGTISSPKMSTDFPAEYISTKLEWEDLVLHPTTAKQIKELEIWVKHNDTLLYSWGMHKKIKPGFRALFYGPPGTGKTLASTLLGKHTNRQVFKIDLSMVVSKYIGETEKNLSKLFDKARNKNWILFFDEADSIFGKRTNVRDAHDKYANQEVSFLLQRIESHPGITIMASNFKGNIDEAFLRRFNACVYFPLPRTEERLKLWKKSFPKNVEFSSEVDFDYLAQKFELTGAHIMNVVHHSCLRAINENSNTVTFDTIKEGIMIEFDKAGRRDVYK